ncbi:MAG: thioredoxin family protein [Methylobacteriaceae bacterium]|nr:thioredoxin family protein [Methylobacteriaceae bacterium]
MLNRRHLLAACAVVGLAVAGAAQAADTPFTQGAFDQSRAAGKPILVEVTAPWCPTCKAQRPILSELKAEPRFKSLTVYEVDFDTQKDALRLLGVQQQSTLIVYKDGREVGRSTGVTDKPGIESLLAKAI